MILAQHEPYVDEHADEPQEVKEEPSDPHDYKIRQDEYQALFFGDHIPLRFKFSFTLKKNFTCFFWIPYISNVI